MAAPVGRCYAGKGGAAAGISCDVADYKRRGWKGLFLFCWTMSADYRGDVPPSRCRHISRFLIWLSVSAYPFQDFSVRDHNHKPIPSMQIGINSNRLRYNLPHLPDLFWPVVADA